MALGTYDDLKASILAHLDDSALSAFVDDFIDIAEARHTREIRIRAMIDRVTVAIAADDRYITYPADLVSPMSFRILNPETGAIHRYLNKIVYLDEDELTAKSTNQARPPRFFTVHEEIEFDSKADQAYTAEFLYYKQLTPLDDMNTVNALLTLAPDVYLYAALLAAEPFMENDERINTWRTLYGEAAEGLNLMQAKIRHVGPMRSRAKGV